jgi:protein-tyrosine phosphatase
MGAVISSDEFSGGRVPLRGTFNLRDVGGYPALEGRRVKWHTLFRSDALHALDEEGPQRLACLGLRSVVDLREDDECRVAPGPASGHHTAHRDPSVSVRRTPGHAGGRRVFSRRRAGSPSSQDPRRYLSGADCHSRSGVSHDCS